MREDLIERLQLKRDVWRGTEFGDDICELLDEAADALEAMRAEVESVTCELMDAITRADKLAEVLQWYAEQVEGCRKIGSIGEPFRKELDRDGGKRARAALHPTAVQENDDA